MTVVITLLAVALGSWVYRVSFAALFTADRLPPAVSARTDAVPPAAFAALITCHLVGTETGSLVATSAALVAAGLTAWITRSHLATIVAAAGAWLLVTNL